MQLWPRGPRGVHHWKRRSFPQDKDGAGADEDDDLEALRARRRKQMKAPVGTVVTPEPQEIMVTPCCPGSVLFFIAEHHFQAAPLKLRVVFVVPVMVKGYG